MVNIDIIVKQVAEKLVQCYNGQTNLKFPKYRNSEDRISEQESKYFFALVFDQQTKPFSFAVEVPTSSPHNFQPGGGKSGKSRSGLHDMAIYKDDSSFDWVIELKSKQPDPKDIKKDFEKMISSDCNCLWFHTLKNSDSGTLSALLDKVNNNLSSLNNLLNNTTLSIEDKQKIKSKIYIWKFAIVILEKKELYTYTLKLDINKTNTISINNLLRQTL
jgi:hypothetical protein